MPPNKPNQRRDPAGRFVPAWYPPDPKPNDPADKLPADPSAALRGQTQKVSVKKGKVGKS